jgi:hypothetical protein
MNPTMAGGSQLPRLREIRRTGEILRFAQDGHVRGLRSDEQEFEILNVVHLTSTVIGSK